MIVLPLSVLLSFIAIGISGSRPTSCRSAGSPSPSASWRMPPSCSSRTRTSAWRRLRPEQTGNGSSSTPARKSVADLLLAAADHRQLPAHLHVGGQAGRLFMPARLHEDVRDVRGRDAVHHARPTADGAPAERPVPHRGHESGQPAAHRRLPGPVLVVGSGSSSSPPRSSS